MCRSEKTILNVPYSEKDLAKGLGARFDWDIKKWYVPPNTKLTAFKRWCNPTDLQEAINCIDEECVTQEDSDEKKGIPLSELLHSVKAAVEGVTASAVWVKAEIIALKDYKWGTTYELGELSGDTITTQCRGKAWRAQQQHILDQCADAQIRLQEGIQALLLVKVKFDLMYGFQVDIIDIDPDFILGKLERKRKEILSTLTKKGILKQNQLLATPIDFEHVIVICPKGSAGQGDFRREADDLMRRGLCEFTYITATFQGVNSSASLQAALKNAIALTAEKPTQAIAIIRGGGATTDLSWLDDLGLATLICESPRPVFTGLGHEKDRSVPDEVSHFAFDTPSKVSLHIRNAILSNGQTTLEALRSIQELAPLLLERAANQATDLHQQLASDSRHLVETYGERIQRHVALIHAEGWALVKSCRQSQRHHLRTATAATGVLQRTRRLVDHQLAEVHAQAVQLPVKAHLVLNAERERVVMRAQAAVTNARTLVNQQTFLAESQALVKHARFEAKAHMHMVIARDPKDILTHGYSIARAPDGTVVTTAQKAVQCDSLTLDFQDGQVQVQSPQLTPPGGSNE